MKFSDVVVFCVILSLANALSLTSEEISEVTETCCSHAEVLAVTTATAAACASSDLPDYLQPGEEDTCRDAMNTCCEDQFKVKEECAAGLKLAASKRCSASSSDIGQRCCDECSFGLSAGNRDGNEGCGSPPSGEGVGLSSFLMTNSYYQCCLDAAEHPETTTEKRTTTSTTTEKVKVTAKCKKDSCDHFCDDSVGVIICSCREGYRLQGDKKTCNDINECAEAIDDLCTAEDTVCHNVPGTFKCVPIKKKDNGLTCPAGFKRNVENQVCDDINECQLPRPPCPKYLCENTIGGFKCAGKPGKPFEELVPNSPASATEPSSDMETPKNDICPPGFRAGADDDCLDIDECAEHVDDCQRLSQHCINTHGDFFCQDHVSKRCSPGFKVNSNTGICEDIDECEESSEVCKRTEVCINLPGAYNCKSKISQLPKLAKKKCQEGTRLRLGTDKCDDIDECREGTHLCDQFQNCINTWGGHECRCKNGFELDSASGSCVDVDECALKLDNCSPHRCLNALGSYSCTRQPATTSAAPPVYEYEYYDSDEENSNGEAENNNEVIPTTTSTTSTTTPKPTTTSTTTTTPKPTTTSTTTTTPKPTTTSTTTPKPTTTSTTSTRPRPYYNYPNRRTTTRRPYSPYTPAYRRPEYPRRPEEHPWIPEDTLLPEYPTQPGYPTWPYDNPRQPYSPRRPDSYPNVDRRPTSTSRPEDPLLPEDPREPSRPEDHSRIPPVNLRPTSRPSTRPYGRRIETTEIPTTTELAPGFNSNDPQIECDLGYEKDKYGACADINECVKGNHVCSSRETCVNREGGYACECKAGYRQSNIGCTPVSSPTTERPSPEVPSRAMPYYPSSPLPSLPPRVACGLGFTYDSEQQKCVDIDECEASKDTCSPLEDCVNMDGGFLCKCGRRCRAENERPSYVPVPPSTPPFLQPSASRSNVITVGSQYGQKGPRTIRPTYDRRPNSIVTSCPWGYKLTPEKRCYDVDECALNVSSCGPQQRCENFFGGYSCQCPAGHRVVGQNNCEDVDECSHGTPCSYNSNCINTVGSYRCECSDGFRNAPSNDKVCEDVDECSETPEVCEQSCTNAWGGYRCYCKRGYRLANDNRTCADINECEEWASMRNSRGKLCGGECFNEPGSYRCACPPGYRLAQDKRSCIDIDECETGEATCVRTPDPGQVCKNTAGSYHCYQIQCPEGYTLQSKHRCSRIQRLCAISDWACLQQPGTYTYNFITFVAHIYLPSGSVDLFTMYGPALSDSVISFEMRMVRVDAGRGVSPASLRCFDMRPSGNMCVVSLLCSLEGPQVAELELSMSLYERGRFAGSSVARLVVIVSEYEF